MPPKKKLVEPAKNSNFIRTDSWNGFKSGDPIKLIGGFLSTRQKGHWEFRYHVKNPDSGAEWIEIFGGTKKDPDSIRSVKPEYIKLIRSRK